MSYTIIYQPYHYKSRDDGYFGPYVPEDILFKTKQAGNDYIDSKKGDWGEVDQWSKYSEGDELPGGKKPVWILREVLLWDSPPKESELKDLKDQAIRKKALGKLTADERRVLGI